MERVLDQARLEQLLDAGRGLLADLDVGLVLDRLLELARELTGAQYAALGILDERRTELDQFLTTGVDEETHRAIGDLPRGRGILGLLIEEPEPLRLHDVGSHPRSYGFPPGHPPMNTFLGVPVIIRGEAWGNLYLTEKAGGEDFDEADQAAVIVLADWAAIAIEHARLYETVNSRRKELERAVRGLEATVTIARAVGAETELERVLELIVKRGRALVDARSVLILLREGDELCVAASAGQLTGVEGYTESAATGLLAGINLARMLTGDEPVVPPPTTMLGALYRYLREADPRHFQPMNANFGLLDDLDAPVRDKRRKRELLAERALRVMDEWSSANGVTGAAIA